jgi:general secretion pathway protein G
MIVLVIIGILAALAIPNMLDAKTRSHQRATVAELRNWGNALGAYMSEVGVVPPAAGGGPVNASTIHNDLVPYAVSALHDTDSWRNNLLYFAPASNTGTSYTVLSGGRDGIFAAGYVECIDESTWFIYDYDIAISDGFFICSPS